MEPLKRYFTREKKEEENKVTKTEHEDVEEIRFELATLSKPARMRHTRQNNQHKRVQIYFKLDKSAFRNQKISIIEKPDDKIPDNATPKPARKAAIKSYYVCFETGTVDQELTTYDDAATQSSEDNVLETLGIHYSKKQPAKLSYYNSIGIHEKKSSDLSPPSEPELDETRKNLAEQVCDLTSSSFKDIVGKLAFVDKTLFIREFLTADGPTWVTAPPKYGKTTNMDMLKTFLAVQVDDTLKPALNKKRSENYKLFKKNSLKFYVEDRLLFKQHFGKYPVVYVDFGKVVGHSKSDILHALRDILSDAYKEYAYLVDDLNDEWSWATNRLYRSPHDVLRYAIYTETFVGPFEKDCYGIAAWKFLFNVLECQFKEFPMVLLDNCDKPLLNLFFDPSLRNKQHVDWIDTVVGELIDDLIEICGKRILLNRTVPLFVPGQNYSYRVDCTFSYSECSKWCGFSTKEVEKILRNPAFKMLDASLIWRYYGNYKIYEEFFCPDREFYNPWSVLNCLQTSVARGKLTIHVNWPTGKNIQNFERAFTAIKFPEIIRRVIFESFEMFRTSQVRTYDVSAYQLLKLVNSSLKTDIDDPDYDCLLHLDVLLFLSYLGYLNKTLVGKQGNRICFYTPNSEMMNALLINYAPKDSAKLECPLKSNDFLVDPA